MDRSTLIGIGLISAVAGLGLGGLLGVGLSKSLADKKVEPTQQVPKTIQVPYNQVLLLKAIAKGTQVYTCKAKPDDANSFAWTLKAPEAQLFDPKGQSIGIHYGGPTWELTDTSKIVGKVRTKVNAPQSDNIPWLLLEVTSHEGQGMLTPIKWVQRVNTVGGQAPTTGCDRIHLNQELPVDYTADYYFFRTQTTPKATH